VDRYLDLLVSQIDAPGNYNEPMRCALPTPENRLAVDHVLAAFGHCVNIPVFKADLRLQSLQSWQVLHSAAMQCSLSECGGTGWVFLGLYDDGEGWRQYHTESNTLSHQTALYFDADRKLQVFFPRVCVPTCPRL
jgi:hypothetical protein